MLIYLESKQQISAAQRKLEATLRRELSQKVNLDIGYRGGRESARVFTDGRFWFWSRDHAGREIANPRRLNWFGHYRDRPGSGIVVEINTAYQGRNDQTAGFFARETETGAVYLMHSGRVGGGKKGVGKDEFQAFYAVAYGETPAEVADSSGLAREAYRVMAVDGVGAARSLIRYIEAVTAFKSAVRAGKIDTPAFKRQLKNFQDFYAEARGRRRGRRNSEIDYISRHGEIVDALHKWRQSIKMPKGARIVKNLLIDMGVAIGRELIEVFEVKPSTTRSNIYSALGQLMVHGAANSCHKVMVLPHNEKLPEDCSKALKQWGIEMLTFKLDNKKAQIVRA